MTHSLPGAAQPGDAARDERAQTKVPAGPTLLHSVATPGDMNAVRIDDLDAPELFSNRELSVISFNERVMALSLDPSVPLLERVRFLTISCSNLDEFFEVRKASYQELQVTNALSFDGRSTSEVLRDIARQAHALVDEQYRVVNDVILPALVAEGIRVRRRADWSEAEVAWATKFFDDEVEPVVTPVALDPAHPFPKILNKSLNFAVLLQGADAFGRDANIAVVQIPRTLPRLINIPPDISGGRHDFVMLSSVVHANVDQLFPGMTVTGCYQFRVTRNSELWVDEEEVEDMLKALEGELPDRRFAEAVRLEVAKECPEDVARFLLERFGLPEQDLYRVDGPVNLNRLGALYTKVDRPDLKYAPFVPRVPRFLQRGTDLFEAIRAGDIVMHQPFESFQPVVELVRRAAADPNVLAIKQTLYRTEENSQLVAALRDAARAGKQVTAVVELLARFDEQGNINLANELQDAGAQVVYGVFGYKTHAKMLMIVRRESDGLRRYVHLSTGNYHSGTARSYTDLGYLTSNPVFGEDVHKLFNRLTGLGEARRLGALLDSPFTLRQEILRLIDAEAENARAGRPARIVAKMNAVTELQTMRALYRASMAGVEIDLIVRGACCLRPGIPGVSDRIRVRSVLGRFLEHSRLYYFEAGGERKLYASSADWMGRNLFQRVETCFPIIDAKIKERVLEECVFIYLEDDVACWHLRADGTYVRQGHRDIHRELVDRITSVPDPTRVDETGYQEIG
ncbi:MAG: polyphosphate kinase 1 [Planctomycetota bacterium]